MAKLIPSILTRDPAEVHEKLKFLERIIGLEEAQIDFADGHFVPGTLVSPRELGSLATRLTLEAHLMVSAPQHYFHDLAHLGFKTVFVHQESFRHDEEIRTAVRNAKHLGLRCGLALNPSTPVEVVGRFAGEIDEALIMGVNPGLQGQDFIPETLARIASLHKSTPGIIIEVDGGVKLHNAEAIASRGASKINVGSGIWQTPDPRATIEKFLKILNRRYADGADNADNQSAKSA